MTNITHTCPICSTLFEGHPLKRYCTFTCRKKAERTAAKSRNDEMIRQLNSQEPAIDERFIALIESPTLQQLLDLMPALLVAKGKFYQLTGTISQEIEAYDWPNDIMVFTDSTGRTIFTQLG